jgi:riboflavin synthase
MFTGLIREIAKVTSFTNNILTIKAKFQPKLGDSIAINGACLTVINITNGNFSVELSPESQKLLAINNYKNEVHIEPAMMMGDRFEGHIVQGHIDCIGTIKSINKNGNSVDMIIGISKEYIKFVIPKGSITIDGVSLTVNDVDKTKGQFRLTIIPHTINNTIFRNYKINMDINIETDMFARYVYNLLPTMQQQDTLSWNEVDKTMARY